MDNGYTIVTINGVDYYCPNSFANNLVVIDGKLVNFGNSNITLYRSIRVQGGSFVQYIQCQSLTYAEIYSSQQNHSTLNVSSFSIKQQPLIYSFESMYLLFAILGVLVCQLFKR